MPKFEEQLDSIYAANRQEWREWLEKNHSNTIGIWLIYYKVKSGKTSVKYSEAVKEALCFGWIDSKVKSIDQERYMQIFTPRKPKSVWSKLSEEGRGQRAEGRRQKGAIGRGFRPATNCKPPNFHFGGGLKPLLPAVARSSTA